MPKIKDIIGKVIGYKRPTSQMKVNIPVPKQETVCADLLTVYEWLLKYKGQAPFFCLMLQEGEDSSFLLNHAGEPEIYKDWNIVQHEKEEINNNNIWILEFEGAK